MSSRIDARSAGILPLDRLRVTRSTRQSAVLLAFILHGG